LAISKLLFSDVMEDDAILEEKPWIENASYANPATIALSLGSQRWDNVFASTTSDHSLNKLSGRNSGRESTDYMHSDPNRTSGRRLFGFGRLGRGSHKEIRLDKHYSKNSLSSTSEPTSSHHSTLYEEFIVQRPYGNDDFVIPDTNVRAASPPKPIRQSLGYNSYSPNRKPIALDSRFRRSMPYVPPRPLQDTSRF
jgi:hypothetical protein